MSQEEPSDRKPDLWPILNGWACAAKICHDGMLEDTNSLDGSHFMLSLLMLVRTCLFNIYFSKFDVYIFNKLIAGIKYVFTEITESTRRRFRNGYLADGEKADLPL